MATETPLERRIRIQKEAEEKGKAYRDMLQTHVGGMEVGLSIVVGALLGFWADRVWETSPWGTLIGLSFGLLAAGRTLYRISKKSLADAARDDEEQAARDGVKAPETTPGAPT